jgi:hypothetical protein
MAEAPPAPPKLLYIAVADGGGRRAFRYTRPVLQSTLQLMGCKARHAFKVHPPSFFLYFCPSLAASAAVSDLEFLIPTIEVSNCKVLITTDETPAAILSCSVLLLLVQML